MKMTYLISTADGRTAYIFILDGVMTPEMVERFMRLGYKVQMKIPTEFNERELEAFVSGLEKSARALVGDST